MNIEIVWDTKTIKENFYGVIRDSKILRKGDLEKKYLPFKEKFCRIYDMAIDSVVNNNVQSAVSKLDTMLATLEKVKNGNMTTKVANLQIGNMLGHAYVYPAIGHTPNQSDYKRAIDEINKKS